MPVSPAYRQRTEHRLFVPKLIKERHGCNKLARLAKNFLKNVSADISNNRRGLFSRGGL